MLNLVASLTVVSGEATCISTPRISHSGQLHSLIWDLTHLLTSAHTQKHSAGLSIASLSLQGGAPALQQLLIQPSRRVDCLGTSTWLLLTCCLQSDLTKQQNGFKITLKTLEDNLLSRLSSASGNFLGETALVENLEVTKQTAAEVEDKVQHSEVPGPGLPLVSTSSVSLPESGFCLRLPKFL